MTITYEYYEGQLVEILPELLLFMTQSIKNADCVKVGITANPKIQWQIHSSDKEKWSKMIVVFQNSSIIQVRTLEKAMVAHGKKYVKNIKSGAGENRTKGTQHVYFLVRN